MTSAPAFQTTPDPVQVYNGPEQKYRVAAKVNADESYTQLVGIDDEWADAFGRLRVSNTATLFEASFTYDAQPLLFEPITTTGGSVTQENSALTLAVDGTAGATASVQSRQYWPYEKGKSQLVKLTGVLGAATTGVRTRFGYFDASDGFYVQQDGDGLSLVRRSSTTGTLTQTQVVQSQWNVDPLDGTGPSGVTLDVTKAQILVLDGQWLGVGRVRVGFNIDGLTYYCHDFLHANREPVAPYTRSFTLPVRYEIATTDGGSGSFTAICCDVESEGGVDSPIGFSFAASNDANVATSTTPTAVLSLRPAADFPDGGRTNRTFIIPGDISLLVAGEDVLVDVQYDPVLSGGTWTRADDNSAVEVGVGQTIVTPGLSVQRLLAPAAERNNVTAPAGDSVTSQYPLVLDAAGANPKAITIVVTALAGTGTVRAATGWREVR